MKKLISLFLCIWLILSMVACENNNNASTDVNESNINSNQKNQNNDTDTVLDISDMFTSRDKEIGYDENSATKLALTGETVTITKEGAYILNGEIFDGQIIVDVADTEKVQLVLDNVKISSNSSAPIYIKSADKVFVTLATGSENTLEVNGEYAEDSENNVDGTIFSKSDITFNGNGTLTINAAYGHGIVGKDDVIFTSGTYNITAEKHGVSANDSVRIADGTLNITSGKDGIQAECTDDETKGFIYIANGKFTINANGDGISASGVVEIEDGSFNVKTGDGSASVTLQSDGNGFRQNMQQQVNTTEEDTVSQKAIKTDSSLTVKNGEFTLDTVDDGFHAAGNIDIAQGNFDIKTGDDGIHSDAAVTIANGNFYIPYCYEGIEGLSVTINGGTFDIVSSDDGFNAAGGTDSSGFGGGGNPFSTTEGAFITINDGTITIVSNGDSIDSNDSLTINGGKLNLTCNGNGNTAIDASGTYSNNGGSITTNDGSESGAGMGTGGGRPSGGGQFPGNGERPEGINSPDGGMSQRPEGMKTPKDSIGELPQ